MAHIVISANTAWSVANFRLGLISHLLHSGHNVTVLAPEDAYVSVLVSAGCKFVRMEVDSKSTSPIRDFALLYRFCRAYRKLKPDAIISFTIKNNIYGGIAASLLSLKFLPVVTGLGSAFFRSKILSIFVRWLYRIAFANLSTIFFLNDDDRNVFITQRIIRPEQAVRIPGEGIDLDRFQLAPFPRDTIPVFLLVARMLWEKGVGDFVEAARILRSQGFCAKFQLLGFVDVDSLSAIPKSTVETWVSEGVVQYLGAQVDVRPYIASATAVVLPTSYHEGLPRALMEAAAMGRPIVTTNSPGCRELLIDGNSGYFCNAGDPLSIAMAMKRVMSQDLQGRVNLGLRGRRLMEDKFSQEIVFEFYDKWITDSHLS